MFKILDDAGVEVLDSLHEKMQTIDRLDCEDLLMLKNKVCSSIQLERPKYNQELYNAKAFIERLSGKKSPLDPAFFLQYRSEALTLNKLANYEYELNQYIKENDLGLGNGSAKEILKKVLSFRTEKQALDLIMFLKADKHLSDQDYIEEPFHGVIQN